LNRVVEAREAATRAHAAFEEAKKGAGYEAAWIERMISPYLGQLDAELAFSEKNSAAAEDSLRKVADELAANPRFDAWGEGLFRLERIAEQAKRSGRAALAKDIQERMRRIDPDYVPGSTARPLAVAEAEVSR
jgi:hypothetical protein